MLECVANLSQLVYNNYVTLMWGHSHCSTDGNKPADVLAIVGATIVTIGHRLLKQECKEQAKSTTVDYWSRSDGGPAT